MKPYTYVMHPVGNSQINPFLTQQMVIPANPQVSYQLSLQFRQCANLTMNAPFNSQLMHSLNTCPFPTVIPQITPSLTPRLIPNIYPQLMGPVAPRPSVVPPVMNGGSVPSVNQQMYGVSFPNMNRFPAPGLNYSPVMSVRGSSVPTHNLAQPVPNLNTQIVSPINYHRFHSVNYHPLMNHISPVTSLALPYHRSQPTQRFNSLNNSQNVLNVNYPNRPILNPQTVMSVREQAPLVNSQTVTAVRKQSNTPSVNSETVTSVGEKTNTPSVNSETVTSVEEQTNTPSVNSVKTVTSVGEQINIFSVNSQTLPPSSDSQNVLSSANPQNIFKQVTPQTFPSSVNPQSNPNAEPNAKSVVQKEPTKQCFKRKNNMKKTKKDRKGTTVFWQDPAFKDARIASEKRNGNSERNPVTNHPDEKMKGKNVNLDDKMEEEEVKTSKPDKVEPLENSTTNNSPLITIKTKDPNPSDDKKTNYFKNLRSSRIVSGQDLGKRRPSENDKIKAKILKIFALMQKLKGLCKKLWQNVAANGEFKDNPVISEEVTKFLSLSHKFIIEVGCIVKFTKKEESSSQEKTSKDAKTKPKDSKEASNTDQKSAASKKGNKMRKYKSVPAMVKFLLKKIDELDDLGLCFVNINGIFIKRYCSMIVKLRKSLNALLNKSKMSLKKLRLKVPQRPCLPQCGAIMLTCHGSTTYAKALHLAMKNIRFKTLGIQCIKKRQSVTGGLILEVFADLDCEKKTDRLMTKLQELYESLEVRVTRPQKYGDLVITRLDPSSTVEEICQQLAKLGNCPADVFKTGSRGKTCIWVRCPLNIAIQLDQKTLEMNSKVARINLKATKFVRCYKCFNVGHIKDLCPSTLDHNNMCFKCGESDHEARNCQNPPRCLTCFDNSLPSCHRLGGEKCPSAIPKFIKRPANNLCKSKSLHTQKKGQGTKWKNANKKKVGTKSISNIEPAPTQARSRN